MLYFNSTNGYLNCKICGLFVKFYKFEKKASSIFFGIVYLDRLNPESHCAC